MAVRDLEPGELVMEDNPVGLSPLQVILSLSLYLSLYLSLSL